MVMLFNCELLDFNEQLFLCYGKFRRLTFSFSSALRASSGFDFICAYYLLLVKTKPKMISIEEVIEVINLYYHRHSQKSATKSMGTI